MHPCGNGGCNYYVLQKVVFKILMISIPSVMVAMYCFNQGKKLKEKNGVLLVVVLFPIKSLTSMKLFQPLLVQSSQNIPLESAKEKK